ncbi:MAG: entericidin A/B family lipoprotein [Alphaproteobacteria bacterium]
MKNSVLVSLFVLSILVLSACSNTAEGMGRDIEKAGQKIQDTF